jgi:hypothetical protein
MLQEANLHQPDGIDGAAKQRAISGAAHSYGLGRRQRQIDELRELCYSSALIRAIHLAFEHFADFSRDDDIMELLADAIERAAAPAGVRRRLAGLRPSQPRAASLRPESPPRRHHDQARSTYL